MKWPGLPGCIPGLPARRSSSGSQPISRSAPVQIRRSALRAPAMRLGRACSMCGSWKAVVARVISTLSPASSSTSAAHSGSQLNTFNALADTGSHSAARTAISRVMTRLLELVGAVRADAHDVLQVPDVVRLLEHPVVGVLQPQAAEFAWRPVE